LALVAAIAVAAKRTEAKTRENRLTFFQSIFHLRMNRISRMASFRKSHPRMKNADDRKAPEADISAGLWDF
jgi:hypothetical protein